LKENLARLRELQHTNVAKKIEAEQEDSKQAFKLDRFKNVGSMVFQNVDFSIPEPPVRFGLSNKFQIQMC
jgi:hypothetical protein